MPLVRDIPHPPPEPNVDLSSIVRGKIVAVTGGTGTFGNAAVRRFLSDDASEVRVFSRDEKKQDDMRRYVGDSRLRFYLGDVRDRDSLTEPLSGADLVFHAAALKQVPSCEFHPIEAVRTNVLGTDNVLAVAQERGVERVVVLSTDKAAYPINAMGMSKGLLEKVAAARARSAESAGCLICATRYGNVLASRGSVVPLFLDQVMESRPLTVTDPTMTRFLMTIEEAIDLVVFALAMGRPGDLFVPKAPAATIEHLAEAMLELFPGRSSGIQVIGTRHGEKRHETLLTREEMARSQDLGAYYKVAADTRDMDYEQFFSVGEATLSEGEAFGSGNARRLTLDEVVETLGALRIVQDARRELGA